MLRDTDAPTRRPERPTEPPPYPAEKARGGEIILRTRWERALFIAGLAGVFVLALAQSLLW